MEIGSTVYHVKNQEYKYRVEVLSQKVLRETINNFYAVSFEVIDWLHENVGKCGTDWSWELVYETTITPAPGGKSTRDEKAIFFFNTEDSASLFKLAWAGNTF